MPSQASVILSIDFLIVAFGVAAMLAYALRLAGAWTGSARIRFLAWLLIPLGAAAAGVLGRFEMLPPPFVVVAAAVTVMTVITVERVGPQLVDRVPLWLLVLSQGFRLPLEVVMHRAAAEGVMPAQMTWTGWNFDILTGITAILLGAWLLRGDPPRALVMAWNVLGFLLLVNVVGVAIASLPMIAAFGPDALNTWVTTVPFVWLPTLLVQAALAGHLLVWKSLARR